MHFYSIYFNVCNKYTPEQVHISVSLLESFKYMAKSLEITTDKMIKKFYEGSYDDIDEQIDLTSKEIISRLEVNLDDCKVIASFLPVKYYYKITQKDKNNDKRCTHKDITVFILKTSDDGDIREAYSEMEKLIV
ncbi:putative ORFan [Tupanvirus deep ocean]|uniref:ORFan n=2 Tax=Tupanvirus TaxID=2094720 RepID=A0AC62A6Z7_9VIRU|nr:putative ORFan [Tupanvirus deep ocean]QKU33559.1 putative ORFan [Tupanvirus deep ocean]